MYRFVCRVLGVFAAALLSGLFSLVCSASDVFVIKNGQAAEFLSPWLFVYEDASQTSTITNIQTMPQVKWVRHDDSTPNYSYTNSAYWFRADLLNRDINRVNGILQVANPLLNDIEFFFIEQGEITGYGVSGSTLPFSQRALPHRTFLFQFQLEPNQMGTLYLRVKSKTSMQVPLMVASEFRFFEADQTDLMMKSAYYGIMLVVILFNLFLFISLREPVYLAYITFIACFAFQQFSMHGFVMVFIAGDFPRLQEFMVLIFMPLTMFFALQFTRAFLSLDKLSPKVSLALKFLQALTLLVIMVVVFLDAAVAAKAVALSAVVVSFACLLVGPYQWVQGQLIARYYTLAWLCVAGGSAILALNKLGFLPRTGFTENGLLAGSAAEAILLSFALADRLNMERSRRYKAQQKMLKESEHRKQAEKRLIHAALHHGITGLPNRLYFERWFDAQLIDAQKLQHSAFVLVHINRFHEINQTLGHKLADELFQQVAKRLNSYMLSRSEFMPIEETEGDAACITVVEGVYLGCLMDSSKVKSIVHGLRDLLSCLSEPLEYEQMVIDISGHAGWVNVQLPEHDGSSLVRSALIAADVGHRKNESITEYEDGINPYSERRLTLAGELRKAIECDRLQLYFQPQFSVKKNAFTSMEALLRWFHDDYGFMPPDEFVPIAEQSGVIHSLTRWVVHQALISVAKVHGLGFEIAVAVNVSAVNLRDRKFAHMIQSALSEHQVESRFLVIEVTETAMMDDPALAKLVLDELAALGVSISIDDFGTGHSSLAYIKQLPVDEIKIDRSFVMDMQHSSDDAVIVRTTLNMCHDLGLEVVAEGVENDEIAEQLKGLNCDYLQGYGLCRPIPLDELMTFLESQQV